MTHPTLPIIALAAVLALPQQDGGPAGPDGSVQFNNNGTQAGDAELTWFHGAKELFVGGGSTGYYPVVIYPDTVYGGGLYVLDALSANRGNVRIGDESNNHNGTVLIVDDINERIQLNKPLVMQSPNGHLWSYSPNDKGELIGTDLGKRSD